MEPARGLEPLTARLHVGLAVCRSSVQGAVPGRGDPSRAVHDLVDPPRRHADGYRKTVLGYGQRLQELFQEPDVQVAGGASGRCV